MVFSSHIFLFYFLPLTLLLYYVAPRGMKAFTLTACSYLFYGWTNPWFILLLLWSTMVDFICGNMVYGHWRLPGQKPHGLREDGTPDVPQWQRKAFVVVSLISNLGMLGFFKYFMFLDENLKALYEAFGKTGGDTLVVLLPAGISFYVFESISYNLDIYFRHAKPSSAWIFDAEKAKGKTIGVLKYWWLELRSLNAFACYITQFPHLVAGPIFRYQDLEKQLHDRTHTVEKFARGVAFFAMGMAKKVIIANPMGDIADASMAVDPAGLPWYDAWVGIFGYAFQLYFDFSAYSDMAIGLALMIGFVFPKNFDSPYKADSITNFWQRWHMSLSTWLRDYLYIPLGGNRLGNARTYCNLMTVMLLGGMWHGAAWNFIVWGGIHGLMLAFERFQGKDSPYRKLPRAGRVLITFAIVCIAWVFFRAKTMEQAIDYLGAMFGAGVAGAGQLLAPVMYSHYHLLMLVVAAGFAFFGTQSWDFTRKLTPLRAATCLALLACAVLLLWTQTANPFLYFAF